MSRQAPADPPVAVPVDPPPVVPQSAMVLNVQLERRVARIVTRLAMVSRLWRQLCSSDAAFQELIMRLLGVRWTSRGATTERLEQQQVWRMDHISDEVDDEIAYTHGEAFGVLSILLAALRPATGAVARTE